MRDIKAEVRRYIVENFLFGTAGGWGDAESLLARGVLDSTGVLELVAFLEERFAIAIEDDELVPENLDSLDAIEAYVQAKAAAGSALHPAAVAEG